MLDAISFNIDVDKWNNEKVRTLRCVYRLQINEYRGIEKLQLLIDYFQPVQSTKSTSAEFRSQGS